MEHEPRRDGYMQRPSWEHYAPDELFLYAQKAQEWVRQRVSSEQQHEALLFLAERLDTIVDADFPEYPEVEAHTSIVYRPAIYRHAEHAYEFRAEAPSPDGDVAVFGEHVVSGRLYGFHQSVVEGKPGIYAYIARDEPPIRTLAGLYTPLWSVPVDEGSIEFRSVLQKNREVELKRDIGGFISALPEENARYLNDQIMRLVDTLGNEKVAYIERIREVARHATFLLKDDHFEQRLLDAVLDLIALKLNLADPIDLQAYRHRIITADMSIQAFQLGGPRSFHNVIATPCFIGETMNKRLGLAFYDEKDVVQVPVDMIENIHHSDNT